MSNMKTSIKNIGKYRWKNLLHISVKLKKLIDKSRSLQDHF
jgi:hypothetical protein